MVKQDSEKRKFKRYHCYVPVDGKQGTGFDHTQTIDISRKGIGFISQTAVPLNEKIAVELVITPDSEPILVMGVVRWVRKISDSDQYRVGMTFSEVLAGSQTRFNKYLAQQFA